MLFVDIRRESAAVCLRISNDPHLAKSDPKPPPPKHGSPGRWPHHMGLSLWRVAPVGNRPFTIPLQCAGEIQPEGGGNMRRASFRL
jgi:hypothetical protein